MRARLKAKKIEKNRKRRKSGKDVPWFRAAACQPTVLADALLDLAKLEAGKTTIEEEEFSLNQLLTDCQQYFASALAAKGLYWQTDVDSAVPERIKSDSVVLKRILSSLISNAINFTNSGGVKVSLAIEKEDSQKPELRFSVIDTGSGMDKEVLPMLFTPFAKISQSAEGITGKGLGLILCKQLTALLHGGLTQS